MRFFKAIAIAAAIFCSTAVSARDFPSRSLKIYLAFPPGTISDLSLRRFADAFSKKIGESVVIVNVPGGNGVSAATAALSAKPDGYTITMLTSANAIAQVDSAFKHADLFYRLDQFVPLSGFSVFSNIIAVNASSPFNTLSDVISFARAHPCKLNVGVTTVNSANYLTAELLMYYTKTKFVLVTHRKVPELILDALHGQVPVVVQSYTALGGQFSSGKLRPIAVAVNHRLSYVKDVPSVSESKIPGLAGFDLPSWTALYALKGTPPDRIAYLARNIREVLEDPAMQASFQELHIRALPSSAEAQSKLMQKEINRWTELFGKAEIQKAASACSE